MVARQVAKKFTGDRRRAVPVGAIAEGIEEFAAAGAPIMRMAPCKTSLPGPEGIPEPAGNELDRLYAALELVTHKDYPRTAKLLASSTRKVAQKVIEEAGEVALAAVKHNDGGIVRESADLLYQLAVLWRRAGISPADVLREMRRRADSFGIAEKLPKPQPGAVG